MGHFGETRYQVVQMFITWEFTLNGPIFARTRTLEEVLENR